MKCSDIPDIVILKFLATQERWCTHGEGHGHMPTVQDAMPAGTPLKLQLAKMKQLLKAGLVDGCDCGCRGDWQITQKGLITVYPNLANYPAEYAEVLAKKIHNWQLTDKLQYLRDNGYVVTKIAHEPSDGIDVVRYTFKGEVI